VAVVVCLTVLAGCGNDDTGRELAPLSGTPSLTTRAGPGDASAATTTAPGAVPTDDLVALVDHGAEPRRTLRLSPEPGTVARVTLRLDSTQRMDLAGEWLDIPVPIVELDQAVTVTNVEHGRITLHQSPYAYRIVDGRGLDPALLAEYEHTFDMLLDLTATATVVDERGRVLDQSMMGEAALYDLPSFEGLVTTTSESSLPLPLEPVGLGARWRVETDSVVSAMRMISVTDLELVELHDDRAVARLTQSVTMPRGFIEGSFDRDEVLDGELHSTGTVTWLFASGITLVDMETAGSMRLSMFRGRDSYRTTIEQHLRSSTFLRD
jgi:hypothetical protein